MKKVISKNFILLFFLPFTFSCASLVSHTNWPYFVESEPAGATVTIENKKGKQVFKGKTPTVARLKSGAGFFAKESYVVTLSKAGYEEKKFSVDCKLNGWYFGNILFGGALGLLIIDPATGAMYKLDGPGNRERLDPVKEDVSHLRSLKIVDIATIPADWHNRLVALK